MSGALTAGSPLRVLVDGLPAGTVPATDRGLQYGDGLFETLLVRHGLPCQWSRHLARLLQGAARLGIPILNPARLTVEAHALADELSDGVLKLLITRGSGGRGYRPPCEPRPRRILLGYPPAPWPPDWAERGVSVRYCGTRAALCPALAGIKHLNRLDSVLARREWDDPGIAEGLMLDPTGYFVGGTMTNLFVWDGSALATPRIACSGIAGTVRALTLDMARASGVRCRERRIRPVDLSDAEGLFLTNSVAGIWPVRSLEGRELDPGRLPWPLLESVRQAAFAAA